MSMKFPIISEFVVFQMSFQSFSLILLIFSFFLQILNICSILFRLFLASFFFFFFYIHHFCCFWTNFSLYFNMNAFMEPLIPKNILKLTFSLKNCLYSINFLKNSGLMPIWLCGLILPSLWFFFFFKYSFLFLKYLWLDGCITKNVKTLLWQHFLLWM